MEKAWNLHERLRVLLERQKHPTHQQPDHGGGLGSSPQALVKRARTMHPYGTDGEQDAQKSAQPLPAAPSSPSWAPAWTAAAPAAPEGSSEVGQTHVSDPQVQQRLTVLLHRQAAVEEAGREQEAAAPAAGERRPGMCQLAGAAGPHSRRSDCTERQPLEVKLQQRLNVLLQRQAVAAEADIPTNTRGQGDIPLPAAWRPAAKAGAQPQLHDTLRHGCQQDGNLVQQRLQVLLQRPAAVAAEAGGLSVAEEHEGDMPSPARRQPAISKEYTSGLQIAAGTQCEQEGRQLQQRLNTLLQRQQGEQREKQGREVAVEHVERCQVHQPAEVATAEHQHSGRREHKQLNTADHLQQRLGVLLQRQPLKQHL